MEHLPTDRRGFMKAASVIAVATAASSISVFGASAQQVPYSAGTEAPKLKAPANACDCHMHIYNANYPVAPSATLKPPGRVLAAAQFTLMFAALITFAHFSVSDAM